MEFVLTKESKEAERKTIMAKGIADFQRIVSQGLSPLLLQWKGIEVSSTRGTPLPPTMRQPFGMHLMAGGVRCKESESESEREGEGERDEVADSITCQSLY